MMRKGEIRKQCQRKNWWELEAMPNTLYAVIWRRESFSNHSDSLTRYVTFTVALDEFNKHKNNLKEKMSYLLHHPYIHVNYILNDSLETESKTCYRKTYSVRKSIEEAIMENPYKKPRLAQDLFWSGDNIFERESDSILPLNRKQITKIK